MALPEGSISLGGQRVTPGNLRTAATDARCVVVSWTALEWQGSATGVFLILKEGATTGIVQLGPNERTDKVTKGWGYVIRQDRPGANESVSLHLETGDVRALDLRYEPGSIVSYVTSNKSGMVVAQKISPEHTEEVLDGKNPALNPLFPMMKGILHSPTEIKNVLDSARRVHPEAAGQITETHPYFLVALMDYARILLTRLNSDEMITAG
ncbi:hypothetical protein HY214_04765 [Candidatus Roizmanbacteria bacterium]|nr:hypothetical protein [Candidatus Roizmanbacteria bacterium]